MVSKLLKGRGLWLQVSFKSKKAGGGLGTRLQLMCYF